MVISETAPEVSGLRKNKAYKYSCFLLSYLGFVAMKRHHDHSNSYKEKYLIEARLQFQRFTQLSPLWGAWKPAGRRGVGEEAENSTT